METIALGLPFDVDAVVTAASLDGHHRPYGGIASCDLDVLGDSRGTPVHFDLVEDEPRQGRRLRGCVESVRPACRSGRIEDGGLAVSIRIQCREAPSRWSDTGSSVLFAHLDPVRVAPGQLLMGRREIGRLGPALPQDWPEGVCGQAHPRGDARRHEYHSACAVHSHVHVEVIGVAFGPDSGPRRGTILTHGSLLAAVPLSVRPEPVEG